MVLGDHTLRNVSVSCDHNIRLHLESSRESPTAEAVLFTSHAAPTDPGIQPGAHSVGERPAESSGQTPTPYQELRNPPSPPDQEVVLVPMGKMEAAAIESQCQLSLCAHHSTADQIVISSQISILRALEAPSNLRMGLAGLAERPRMIKGLLRRQGLPDVTEQDHLIKATFEPPQKGEKPRVAVPKHVSRILRAQVKIRDYGNHSA